jgi:hypothetical protein
MSLKEYSDYFETDPNKKLKPYNSYFEDNTNESKKKSSMGDMFHRNSSSILGTNTSYGKSVYDKNLNWGADVKQDDIEGSLNEHRAQEQSGALQLAEGLGRAATKAVTEVAKLPGVIGGIVAAPFVKDGEGYDMAFNNAWIRTLDSFQDKINTDLLPVYTKKAVETGDLWDNISSTSFWATDGADGLGFILGMMAPGAIFEYAGLGGKLIQAASNSSKLAKYTSCLLYTSDAADDRIRV